jgi:hypothetical protein
MNKTIFISILLFMMATTALLTSCSEEDTFEDIIPNQTAKWIEPYHIMSSSMDQVKLFMANEMKDFKARSSQANTLAYSKSNDMCGILYCFSPVTGELYSVIDTELLSSKASIHKTLKEHYASLDDPATGNTYYYNTDKSLAIVVSDYDNTYCNVTYAKVSQ